MKTIKTLSQLTSISVSVLLSISYLLGVAPSLTAQAPSKLEEELGSPEESEAENQQSTEAATESMEERRGQQEQKLEQELNIDEPDPGKPKVEDVDSPGQDLGLDDNETFQPADDEVEVKF